MTKLQELAAQPEKALGKRLQDARRGAGLTQQKLCQLSNLSYSTLAKIERGAIKSPSIFTIQSIAAALDVSLDTLLGTGSAASNADAGAGKQTSRSGISFVYFDINGCLLHFFHRAFVNLATDTGVSAETVEATFWHYNDDVCRGTVSMSDFNAALAKRIGVPSVDWMSYYLDAVEAIPGMDDLVAWTAQHYRVGLLTNIMPGFVSALQERKLLPATPYEVVIDSSVVGAIKPDRKIYEIATERAGVKPEEILLIDDTRPNLMAAEEFGWHVLWCDDYRPSETVERVRQVLEP